MVNFVKNVLISVNNDIESGTISPRICEIGHWNIITFHVLFGPLQKCFLCSKTLFTIISFDNDFFDLKTAYFGQNFGKMDQNVKFSEK